LFVDRVLKIEGLPIGEYILWKKYPYIAGTVIRVGTSPESKSAKNKNPDKEKYVLF
jgi:hypothetical protein